MERKETSSDILAKVKGVFSRFPLAFAILAALFVFAAIAFYVSPSGAASWLDEDRKLIIILYLAQAAFLSVGLALWKEEKPELGFPVKLGLHALLLASAIYFLFSTEIGYRFFGYASVSMAIAVFCLMASFFKEKDDVQLVNFTIRMFVIILASGIVSLVFMLALFLMNFAFNALFQIEPTEYCYELEVVFSWGLLFPGLIFSFVPMEKKHDNSRDLGKFLMSVLHFLLVPILGIYLVMLYVYAAKILFTWTLPNGGVVAFVSASVLGSIVLLILLYPSAQPSAVAETSADGKTALEGRAHSFDGFIRTWLPVLLLPPLVLMTIGIARRISDYGITAERLYVALANLWSYAVCIGLIVTRGKRLWWIPASFATVMLLASVGPQSFGEITKRVMLHDVKETMTSAGVKNFPLDSEKYGELLESMDSVSTDRMESKLGCLLRSYPLNVTAPLIDADAYYDYDVVEDSVNVIDDVVVDTVSVVGSTAPEDDNN